MRKFLAIAAVMFGQVALATSPCDGLDYKLSTKEKAELGSIFAARRNVESSEIVLSYRFQRWMVFGVSEPNSEDEFLFFSKDPKKFSPIGTWSGSATLFEEKEMREWLQQNIKGIPPRLRDCFAWWATQARNSPPN